MAVAGQPDQSGITRPLSTINSLMCTREARWGGEEGERERELGGEEQTVQSSQAMLLFVLSVDRRRVQNQHARDDQFNPQHPVSKSPRLTRALSPPETPRGREGGGSVPPREKAIYLHSAPVQPAAAVLIPCSLWLSAPPLTPSCSPLNGSLDNGICSRGHARCL
ncbi:Hypothetical predicted protein [Xyrichtys novacula]|uniref:Uncharacterized protein n=1 Tax=Xyrichtys novacula TaxID=13765 RepID=A0AAV1GA17_XYRNO|nr:Hypothetical predicted protein [Xyrichtys novacula]